MQRHELSLSDQEIADLVKKVWGFTAHTIDYIEFGSTFAFGLKDKTGVRVFLKIYKKAIAAAHLYNSTPELLLMNCKILDRLHKQHNMQQIPVIIKTHSGEYLYEFNHFMLVILHYLEGVHPRYQPNELKSPQLAGILSNLHAVRISAFPEVARETFDINFAVGFQKWLETTTNEEKIRPMLEKIAVEKGFLQQAISILKQLRERVVNIPMKLVLTHGDAHHFNVLQTSKELYLIDWDDIKVAPRERDLWHYEFAPLMTDYMQLEPKFVLNHELCLFYRLQRFLDDLRLYIEKVTHTSEQAQANIQLFCNNSGWIECANQIKALSL